MGGAVAAHVDRRLVATAAALMLATAAFALGVTLLPPRSFVVHLVADLGWTAMSAIAAIRCLLVARRTPLPDHRRAFRLFAAGSASWCVGMVVWDIDELARHVFTPFPSIADAFFVAFVPLVLLGVGSYARDQPDSPFGMRRVGDLVLVGSTLTAVVTLVYGGVSQLPGDTLYTAAAFAYPIVSVSGLAFVLLGVAYRRFPPHQLRVFGALVTSLATIAGANVVYGHSLLTRDYEAGRVLDVFWFAAFAAITFAASLEEHGSPDAATPARRELGMLDGLLAPLCVATVCGFVARFGASLPPERTTPIAVAGFTFCIGAAIRGVAAHRLERELRETIRAREREFVAAQRMEAVATLAGGLAHDFNNLLTGILAGASLLKQKGQLAPHALAYAEMVEQSALRAAEITRRLLTLAKRPVAAFGPTHLAESIRRVTTLLRSALPETVSVVESLPDRELVVHADAAALEQALLNLGINAGHAMPEGGTVTFALALEESETRIGGPAVVFRVLDEGGGIPDAIRDRVFDPFFTTREGAEGSGLGLAMVRATASDHGGYVDFAARPTGGTEFRLVIPRIDRPAALVEPDTTDGAWSTGPETILLVDDRATPLLAARSVLETAGYHVVTADGVASALLRVDETKDVALIVSDAVMPNGGVRALREALEARGVGVPVVVMSGHGDLADGGPGEVVRIAKPFLPSELVRAVRTALDARTKPHR